jgi:hypothetical protein
MTMAQAEFPAGLPVDARIVNLFVCCSEMTHAAPRRVARFEHLVGSVLPNDALQKASSVDDFLRSQEQWIGQLLQVFVRIYRSLSISELQRLILPLPILPLVPAAPALAAISVVQLLLEREMRNSPTWAIQNAAVVGLLRHEARSIGEFFFKGATLLSPPVLSAAGDSTERSTLGVAGASSALEEAAGASKPYAHTINLSHLPPTWHRCKEMYSGESPLCNHQCATSH